MSRTTREYFPVRRGGVWVGEASHQVNTGGSQAFDHDTILSFGHYGTKILESAIWFVMDVFEEEGYVPMLARLEVVPSVDADVQDTGRFRVGMVIVDGAWNGATVFGFDDDTYPDTTILPYPTADGSDVIIPGVIFSDEFLLFAGHFTTFTKDVPISFGDGGFADLQLTPIPNPPGTQGEFAALIQAARIFESKPGQMCFVMDPFQLPASGVESVDLYGAGWNLENGGAYVGPKLVVEWEAPDSTASVPADIRSRVGVPLADFVPACFDAGAVLVAVCTAGVADFVPVCVDAGVSFDPVCTTATASLTAIAVDAGATLGG